MGRGISATRKTPATALPSECNYHYFEQRWMEAKITTSDFLLALGALDLGEPQPRYKPKRKLPKPLAPVNKFCREILRGMKVRSAFSLI